MNLVDPKMMLQPTITAPVNPIHRSIVTLDDDMRTVLDRRDLSDEEKVRQYNQILQRYLEYHDHLKTPSGKVVGGLLAWCPWGWHQLEVTPMGIRRPR